MTDYDVRSSGRLTGKKINTQVKARTPFTSQQARDFLLTGGGRSIKEQAAHTRTMLNGSAVRDMQKANVSLANELTRWKEQYTSLAQAFNAMKETQATNSTEMRHTKELHAKKLELLKCQLAQTSVDLKAARAPPMKRATADTSRDAARFELQLADLQSRLEKEHRRRGEAEAEEARMQKKLKRTCRELKRRLAAEEEWRRQLECEAGFPVHELVSHLQDAKEATASAADRLEKLEQEVQQLMHALDRKQAALDDAHRQQQESDLRMEGLQAELSKARGELAATQKLLTEADTMVYHQRHECKDLEQRLHDVKQEHSATQADLRALRQQHAQLQRDSKAAMARLEKELDRQAKKARAAEARAISASERLQRRQNEADRLAEHLDTLEQRYDDLAQECDAKAHAAASAESRVQDREEALRRQASEMRQTEEQASIIEAQAEQLQCDLTAAVKDAALHRQKAAKQGDALQAANEGWQAAQEHEDELRQQHAVQLGTMEAALKEAAALDVKSREALESAERLKTDSLTRQKLAEAECARAKARQAAEAKQAANLRAQIARILAEQQQEQDTRCQAAELLANTQVEEAAKLAAQKDARLGRQKMAQLQIQLIEANNARQRAEATCREMKAQLEAASRRAKRYQHENLTMLGNYDGWLQTLAENNTSSPADLVPDV